MCSSSEMFASNLPIPVLCTWIILLTLNLPGMMMKRTPSTPSPYFYERPAVGLETTQNYSELEGICVQNGGTFYEPDGKCYKLLEQGPCSKTQWLIYDKQESIRSGRLCAVCSSRSCEPGLHYYPDHNKCYPTNIICTYICPETGGFQFRYNHFGEGRCYYEGEGASPLENPDSCKCLNGSSCLWDNPDNTCYFLYRRGPCPLGYVVTPTDDPRRIGVAECRLDPCFGLPELTGQGMIPFLLDDGEIICFELGTQGPCEQSKTFTLFSNSTVSHAVVPYLTCKTPAGYSGLAGAGGIVTGPATGPTGGTNDMYIHPGNNILTGAPKPNTDISNTGRSKMRMIHINITITESYVHSKEEQISFRP